ncbi:sensor histidine kinase [Micromonospora oryzae]|uniref:sensor histidine kinase n=1 Tax=Micromonospora sp. DSM 102119 TaxID=3111768 RepID=UPI0031DBDA53
MFTDTHPHPVGTSEPIGASEGELVRSVSGYALWVRTAVVVMSGALSFVAAGANVTSALVCLVAGAAAWCSFQLIWRLRKAPADWFIAVECLMLIAVGFSQVILGPQMVGSWVFTVVSITTVTCHFEWSHCPVGGYLMAGLSVCGYALGNVLSGSDKGVAGLCLGLVVQSLLAWMSLALVRTGARVADRIAGRAGHRRRMAAVAIARRAAELEDLAMLHDTASTTLLMVSSGAPDSAGWLPDRARRDLEVLGSVHGTVARDVDLSSLLGALREYAGVPVRLDVRESLAMPAKPAFAIFLGAQEALNNVRQHAGDTDACLRVGRDDCGRVLVELRDLGRGFHPADVSPHRRGISGSIVARMSAAGGSAQVVSRPGAGTTVRWFWPAGDE